MTLARKSTLTEIARLLVSECDTVDELSPQETRRVWREWHKTFPLKPKPPHSLLDETIVDRLIQVTGRLNGRNAMASYKNRDSSVLFILALGQLTGWQCQCTTPPSIETLNANLIVSPYDFAWTFGTQRKSWDDTGTDPRRFVYLEPNLDGSCADGHLPSMWRFGPAAQP